MTMANGRCESEPMACESAAGSRPSVATSMVIMIGRKRCTFHRSLNDAALVNSDCPAVRAQLVDEFHHDHAGLHRDAEQCQKSNRRRDAEKLVCVRNSASRSAKEAMTTVTRISIAHLNERNMV